MSTSSAVNLKQLTDCLVNLQIGIRKISMYSLNHSIVPKVISGLTQQFQALLTDTEQLTLGLGKDVLLYRGAVIANTGLALANLIQILHQMNLLSVSFRSELSEGDLRCFLKFIVENRGESFTENSPKLHQFHQDARSIELKVVSFKDAISRYQDRGKEDEHDLDEYDKSIWQDLFDKLKSSEGRDPFDGISHDRESGSLNSVRIADVLNEFFPESMLEESAGAAAALSDCLHAEKISGRPEQQVKSEIELLLSHLRPELRVGLFRESLKAQVNEETRLQGLIEMVPPTFIPEILDEINFSEPRISKPILSLLKKMTTRSGAEHQHRGLFETKLDQHRDIFNALFSEPPKGTVSDSPEILDLETPSPGEIRLNAKAFAELNPIDSAQCELTLIEIILQLLDLEVGRPLKMTASLNMLCSFLTREDLLLDQGIFIETFSLLLEKVQRENKGMVLVDAAQAPGFWRGMLKSILSTATLRPLVLDAQHRVQNMPVDSIVSERRFPSRPIDEEKDALCLLKALARESGPNFFPPLFKLLQDESERSTRKYLLRFIADCGEQIIPYALDRLATESWFVVRNMLVLLKNVEARDATDQIAFCLRHDSEKVRLAALQTLRVLVPDTPLFLESLENALFDEDEKVWRAAAIFFASNSHLEGGDRLIALLQNKEHRRSSCDRLSVVIKNIGISGGGSWQPTLSALDRGFFYWLTTWGSWRALQKEIRIARTKIKQRIKDQADMEGLSKKNKQGN